MEIIEEMALYSGHDLDLDDMGLLNIILESKVAKEKGSEFVKCGIDNITLADVSDFKIFSMH